MNDTILSTGANGQPKITHGNTLVSELSFEEVVETINVSIYTVIVSYLATYRFNDFSRNMHFVFLSILLFSPWKITAVNHSRYVAS